MSIIYSSHARKRMLERNIKHTEIKETIDIPEYTINRGDEIEAYKRVDGKMLKVVYANMGKFINVITVYYL